MTKNTQWASRDKMKQALDTAIRNQESSLDRLGRLYDNYHDRDLNIMIQLDMLIAIVISLISALKDLRTDL